ncbi:FAD binding domain-containing protein [uncultured Jatrophihabitans sp.]|uniref:FAD binding domain-containing protein n=1 Tax=uncultured Jatrophihabitans sp. TaxID=1610747 RepID=UPI0035CBA58C
MRSFDYTRPDNVAGAVLALAARPDGHFLGGGSNLVDLMKLGVETPDALVDVSRLPLDGVEVTPDGGLRIGAGVRNSDLAAHPEVTARYPVLSQALLAGASGQLRNVATTGGNLLQRTRCVYFTDPSKPCNKRAPGTGCPAREGDHRNLAIFGNAESCVATHPSDMAVAMAALDAAVLVTGPNGDRRIPLTDLHRTPAESDDVSRDTVLDHADLITAVELPALSFGAASTYRKARDRASYAFAVGSVAAALDVADGTVRDVRLAWGAVAGKPWRAYRAEDVLRGRAATAESFAAAADAELEGAEPLRDNGFKVPLLRSMTVAVLQSLTNGACS